MKNKFNIPIIDVSSCNLRNKERIALNNFIQKYDYTNIKYSNIRYNRIIIIKGIRMIKYGIDLLIVYKKIKL
jgi:hypothetical protein